MIEQPLIIKICDVREETSNVKSFFFEYNGQYTPGQFLMVWIPQLDEKPFAVSYCKGNLFGITVLKRGRFTQALLSKKKGDFLGIRGPYGRGYNFQKDMARNKSEAKRSKSEANVCIIGGGIGMASLATLIDALHNVTILQGTRTAHELLYLNRFEGMRLCTDDGSAGFHGTTVDLLETMLTGESRGESIAKPKDSNFQKIYSCGPEKMLYKVVQLCNKYGITCEVSIERYMKCGFGVCGQCDCSGRLVCVDGPVFHGYELAEMPDFGNSTITGTGERIFF